MGETTVTLADLVTKLGPTTDDELRVYFQNVPESDLVHLGKRIATPRIATDAPHIVGDAAVFMDGASEEQLDSLGAVSRDTLRLAIGAARLADTLCKARNVSLQASRNKLDEHVAVSEQVARNAIGRRTVLTGMLEKIACGVEPFASRVRAACSKSEDPKEVADALDALIGLGREMLADPTAGLVARRKTTRLSAAILDRDAGIAARLRQAAERAQAVRTAPPVAQTDVDLRDGWALTLLAEIVDAFDDAHEADPTIPRLSVYSLRAILRPPRGKKSAGQPPQAPPAP
jgi:hypothetical protein